jgi:hypothetical protein
MSPNEVISMLQILLTLAAGIAGYLIARNFVRNRLRFVDAIHAPWAPLVAGAAGFVLAWPVALLPLLGTAPAVVFGLGIGLGTAKGARMVRRADGARRQLAP